MDEILNEYPRISKKLLERLTKDFPDQIPRKECSQFEFGLYAGMQVVIDKLKFEYDQQQNEE